jgi:PPOX class probable F420-dependent enzyme
VPRSPLNCEMTGAQSGRMGGIAIPAEVRGLLESPNYLHLATLRADGSPRSWVVWVGIEGERLLICTDDSTWKAKDMRRDPRVSASVVDLANPYRMAANQGPVIEARPDVDCSYMDPISMKYTSAPFPYRGPGRVCFVIAVLNAGARSLNWLSHRPQTPAMIQSRIPEHLDLPHSRVRPQ